MKYGLSFADDHMRQMRERGKVAGSADRTLGWNHRMEFCIQHLAERFDDAWPHATKSLGEGVCAQNHQRASLGFAERFANSARMGTHQIDLQLPHLLGRNAHRSELAKAGVDAVSGRAGSYQALDDRARRVHARSGRGGEPHCLATQSDRVELSECKIVARQQDAHVWLRRGSGAVAATIIRLYFSGSNLGRPLLPQIT